MSVHLDADAFVRWGKREFDLPAWLTANAANESVKISATVWQQMQFGIFAWASARADKRSRYLKTIEPFVVVAGFGRLQAERAASLQAELRLEQIGFGDFQIAATALVDGARLLTFNVAHFSRVPNLSVIKI